MVTINNEKDQVIYSRTGAAHVSQDVQYSNAQDGDNAERTDGEDPPQIYICLLNWKLYENINLSVNNFFVLAITCAEICKVFSHMHQNAEHWALFFFASVSEQNLMHLKHCFFFLWFKAVFEQAVTVGFELSHL